MNSTTKVYQANQSVSDLAAQIDGTIIALIKDRVRQASLSSPNLWDYEFGGWRYFLCQCLVVRWLAGGESELSKKPTPSGDVRDARIIARRANLNKDSIEYKEDIIGFAPNYDIRFSFEVISQNKTYITVATPANVWDKLLSRITAEWEPVKDEQPIKQSESKHKSGGPSTAQPAPSSPTTQPPTSPATTINWETLSGPQQGEFVDAMLSAHGNRSSLEQVLRFELDERLDEVAGSGNMREVTMTVVTWAVDNGKAKALFDGARNRNDGNPALKALEAKLLSMVPTAPPPPKPESTATDQPAGPENSHSPTSTTTAGERGVAIGGDVSGGGVIITGDGNQIILPPSSAPFPGQESSSSTGSAALDIWREKLEFLLAQEAIITDPSQKFALKKQIEEAEAKIRALS